MTNKIQHHELTAEWVDDSQGRAIILTQHSTGYDEPETVLLHAWQLKGVCEQFGIIASDPTAATTLAMLTRRLESLSSRVHFLADYLANNSDHKHADLDYETTYARATSDIAYEFCLELDGVQPCTEPSKQATEPVKPLAGADTRQLSIEA